MKLTKTFDSILDEHRMFLSSFAENLPYSLDGPVEYVNFTDIRAPEARIGDNANVEGDTDDDETTGSEHDSVFGVSDIGTDDENVPVVSAVGSVLVVEQNINAEEKADN